MIVLSASIYAMTGKLLSHDLQYHTVVNCFEMSSDLCEAIASGNEEYVKEVLRSGSPSNVGDPIVLHTAAMYGNASVVQILLEAGAPVNVAASKNRTALMIAAEYGHNYVVQILLDSGASVATRSRKMSALHFAIRSGHLPVVSTLIAAGAPINTSHATAPIFLAAQLARSDILALLLRANAYVYAVDKDKRTALHHACIRNHAAAAVTTSSDVMEVIRILVEAGVDIDAEDKNSHTALMLAVKKENRDAVVALLDMGANIDYITDDDESALHIAIHKQCSDIIKLLLARGASVTADKTLSCAVTCERTDIIRMLLDAGASSNVNALYIALCEAIAKGNPKIVNMMLSVGAPIDGIALSDAPLVVAVQHSQAHIVQMLLEAGAHINARECVNYSVWLGAMTSGDLDVILILLRAGMTMDADCLKYAPKEGIENIVRVFLEAGGDASAVTRFTHPLLDRAKKQNPFVRFLFGYKILRCLKKRGRPETNSKTEE